MILFYISAQLAGAVVYSDASLLRGNPLSNKCPRYNSKHSNGEAPVMPELCGMQITPSRSILAQSGST